MARMPDGFIGLTVTDPPYGKNASKGTNGFGSSRNRRYTAEWDRQRPDSAYFDEILRVSKFSVIFGGNYFADLLPPSNCWIVWDKKGMHEFENPFADAELAWTSFPNVVKKYTFVQQGFVTEAKEPRYHPTQKPVEILARIIADFSKEGDLIYDPFLGSGTTAIAAHRLNRRWIGSEISAEYVELANKRLEPYLMQEQLF
jgi:site-specific DNA-methyltransferase (adenine-specific)